MSQPSTEAIDAYLRVVSDHGGSDLLLTAGSPPLMRIDGTIGRIPNAPSLAADTVEAITYAVLGDALTRRFVEHKEVDFSLTWAGCARLRGNAFRQRGTVALAIRLIPLQIPSFAELGLPALVEQWVRLPQGFILVTGPTGSGKSTTLASIIDHINIHRSLHIITIEDPIEYLHDHKGCAVNQRAVGVDTDSFASALRSALREDPDVVLVGEMRDLDSIRSALTIAETGHLVFATLHTNDTSQALDRIVDVFPAEQQPQVRLQLANTLVGILNQRLVPKGAGGRVAAFEILVGTSAVKNLIKEGKTRQIRNLVITGQRDGMQTLEYRLSELASTGVISYDNARAHSAYPNEVKDERTAEPFPTAQPAWSRR
ncbi:MAG TPA: type IV pilus twitching motility protein PilT [Mycobacterium sp.]|nr:type IV pilus twitching motility protein PilT [Mycobacterium sp.]